MRFIVFSTVKETIAHIISELLPFYAEEEARELAYWIVEYSTGMTRTEMLFSKAPIMIPNLEIILDNLRKHIPIQYVFGHTDWMGLRLHVTSATLIPRPETAELVEWMLSSCDQQIPLRIADIGTGSGCIAIALKKKCPIWQVQGIDISSEALEVAKMNAQENNVDIEWKRLDILSETSEQVDIIVSNPPYICNREKVDMDARVLDYEPHTALFVPDNDPLLFYRRIASIKIARSIFFEINEAYSNEVCDMMQSLGYIDIQLKTDIYGKPRMVFGRIKA